MLVEGTARQILVALVMLATALLGINFYENVKIDLHVELTNSTPVQPTTNITIIEPITYTFTENGKCYIVDYNKVLHKIDCDKTLI